MKILRKGRRLNEKWMPWFAWFPISVEVASGPYQWAWIWLDTVERKQTIGYGGVSYRYREIVL